ncbi:MAG: SCO family protein [Gemmatimonadales bacterium]
MIRTSSWLGMKPALHRFLALALLLGPIGCHRPAHPATASNHHGVRVSPAFPKPDFTLAAMDGSPFNFRQATQGYVTLLFFGYTHCPDVCPLHLANIAAVLHRLDPELAKGVRVVFVTTDPARDTPDRLRQWLGGFDPGFIGLRGPVDSVNLIQESMHLGPAIRETLSDTSYAIAHGALVLAYSTDNLAHLVYPAGMGQEDWANDLPKLVREPPPAD